MKTFPKILSTDIPDALALQIEAEAPLRELFVDKLKADMNNYIMGIYSYPDLIMFEAKEKGVQLPERMEAVLQQLMSIGEDILGKMKTISPEESDKAWEDLVDSLKEPVKEVPDLINELNKLLQTVDRGDYFERLDGMVNAITQNAMRITNRLNLYKTFQRGDALAVLERYDLFIEWLMQFEPGQRTSILEDMMSRLRMYAEHCHGHWVEKLLPDILQAASEVPGVDIPLPINSL